LQDYACSVDQAEEYTGIDFFPDILNGPERKTGVGTGNSKMALLKLIARA
jgi:hypothetical protein